LSKFLFGYYVTAGDRWCKEPRQAEVKEWTDLDVYLWRQFDSVSIDRGLRDLRRAVKWSVKHGRAISLDLDMGYAATWRRQINKASARFVTMPLADPWRSVALVDVADEPSPFLASRCALQVQEHLASENLSAPPVGATFSYQLKDEARLPELDWVGLEAYVDVRWQNESPETLRRILVDQLRQQAARLTLPEQRLVVILQAYSRNGGWINTRTLRQVQLLGAEVAVELFGTRLLAIKMFSWERPSGTRSLSFAIRQAHHLIWSRRAELPPPQDIPHVPPPSGAALWVTKARAGTQDTPGKLIYDTMAKLQENIWAGARDWVYLLQNCGDCFNGNPLKASAVEIREFASVGFDLDGEGPPILLKLMQPHPKYADRVNVKKAEWSNFSSRLDAHLAQAHKYREDFKGQPGEGKDWDSVKGWCAGRNRQ